MNLGDRGRWNRRPTVMQRVTAMTMVMVMSAACGTAEPEDPGSGSSGSEVIDDEVCPNFVLDIETGPPPEITEDGPVGRAQTRLQSDVETISRYGAEHPETFGSVRYENAPWVRLVVGVTGDIETHCRRLRAMLEYPDEFEIFLQATSQAELIAALDEIVVMAGEHLQSAGRRAVGISVDLRADGVEAAERIFARFGGLAKITLGGSPYPPDDEVSGLDCSRFVGPEIEGSPLAARARLDSASVRSGENFSGSVEVTNTGVDTVTFESGEPMTALVYRAGDLTPVGAYTGGIAGVGLAGFLGPDESLDIDFVGGTASCDRTLGYAVPPGEYEVRVPVRIHGYLGGELQTQVLMSEAVSLTVTP